MLKKRDVDVAILRGDFDWPERKHIILEEPFCVVSAHPLKLEQLPYFSWIQYETAALTKMDNEYNSWWRERFNDIALPPIIKVDSIEACIQLVSHGIGWTIIPKIHVGTRRSFFSHPIVWSNGQPMLKQTVMAYRNEALARPAAKAFIDFVLHECFT